MRPQKLVKPPGSGRQTGVDLRPNKKYPKILLDAISSLTSIKAHHLQHDWPRHDFQT